MDALPKPIADMVDGVAEATQTDPAMPATSALSALSACTGGHAEIEIRSGWREPLNLYTVTIAAPGERKTRGSACSWSARSTTRRGDWSRTVRQTRMAAEDAQAGRDERRERQRNEAARAEGDDAQQEAFAEVIGTAALIAEASRCRRSHGWSPTTSPRRRRPHCSPSRVERWRSSPLRAGSSTSSRAATRRRRIPNMDLWLKGHSGDPLRVDRKGRPPEHIPRPALTLGLMIQPAVLATIAANQQFRGRGFWPVSSTPARCRRWAIARRRPRRSIRRSRQRYGTTRERTRAGMADGAATTGRADTHRGRPSRSSSASRQRWSPPWAGDGELASLADWGAKYAGAVARIAGILHLTEHGADQWHRESRSASRRSWRPERIGEYFKASADQRVRRDGHRPGHR